MRPEPTYPNQHWSMDFMHDQLADGRRFRCLTLVDHFSRVSPAIEVGPSLTGERVVSVLERLAASHGLPEVIFVDNGTEFTSKAVDRWAYSGRSQPGLQPPWKTDRQRLHRILQQQTARGVLGTSTGSPRSLKRSRSSKGGDRPSGRSRPHSSLGQESPAEYLSIHTLTETSEELDF